MLKHFLIMCCLALAFTSAAGKVKKVKIKPRKPSTAKIHIKKDKLNNRDSADVFTTVYLSNFNQWTGDSQDFSLQVATDFSSGDFNFGTFHNILSLNKLQGFDGFVSYTKKNLTFMLDDYIDYNVKSLADTNLHHTLSGTILYESLKDLYAISYIIPFHKADGHFINVDWQHEIIRHIYFSLSINFNLDNISKTEYEVTTSANCTLFRVHKKPVGVIVQLNTFGNSDENGETKPRFNIGISTTL